MRIKPGTVVIDGMGGVGKNAAGSLLAKRLGYRLDAGVMYQAMTWGALQPGIEARQ